MNPPFRPKGRRSLPTTSLLCTFLSAPQDREAAFTNSSVVPFLLRRDVAGSSHARIVVFGEHADRREHSPGVDASPIPSSWFLLHGRTSRLGSGISRASLITVNFMVFGSSVFVGRGSMRFSRMAPSKV